MTQFRHGSDFLEKGMIIKLVKKPDNEYDKEAIRSAIRRRRKWYLFCLRA